MTTLEVPTQEMIPEVPVEAVNVMDERRGLASRAVASVVHGAEWVAERCYGPSATGYHSDHGEAHRGNRLVEITDKDTAHWLGRF